MLKTPWQRNILANNNINSLMYQLSFVFDMLAVYLVIEYNFHVGKQLNRFLFSWYNFKSWMIGMVCNHLLVKMNWSYHVLKNSNSHAPRPAISISDEMRKRNKLNGNEPLNQQYQQKFRNLSYRSNYCHWQQYTILFLTVTSQHTQQSEFVTS